MKPCALLAAMSLVVVAAWDAHGVVVELNAAHERETSWDPRLPHQLVSWDFDYATQTLTLREAFYRVPDGSGYGDRLRTIFVQGHAQGPSTFTVVEKITNTTSTGWTGYKLLFSVSHTDDITSFVFGSTMSDSFSEVSASGPGMFAYIDFSNGVVGPGETLSIQYEISTDSPIAGRGTAFIVYGTPIPEPASFLMLGCGSMLLLRRRRSVRGVE